ncbi:MAG: hypothetical protein U0869_01965 [Chloroflexota bacterium]
MAAPPAAAAPADPAAGPAPEVARGAWGPPCHAAPLDDPGAPDDPGAADRGTPAVEDGAAEDGAAGALGPDCQEGPAPPDDAAGDPVTGVAGAGAGAAGTGAAGGGGAVGLGAFCQLAAWGGGIGPPCQSAGPGGGWGGPPVPPVCDITISSFGTHPTARVRLGSGQGRRGDPSSISRPAAGPVARRARHPPMCDISTLGSGTVASERSSE